jgi:hypothetical protein
MWAESSTVPKQMWAESSPVPKQMWATGVTHCVGQPTVVQPARLVVLRVAAEVPVCQ